MKLLKKGILFLSRKGLFKYLPDKTYLKLIYRCITGNKLNLKNPQSFNEKIQWLKLYNRKPEYTKMVDKYSVREYIKNTIGEEYLIPLIGVWDNADDIDFDSLPNQFVLKCTHDSGGIVICNDKSNLNVNEAKETMNKYLHRNFYSLHREWPYKNIKPRIIAEKLMVDESGYELKDYKFFAFDGQIKALFVATGRNSADETCFTYFDRDFNRIPLTNGHPNSSKQIVKPANFEKMITVAEKLSEGIPHVRVDLYNINGKIYFGEMTFFHWSGFKEFEPEKYDKIFGDWITLPKEITQ